MDARRQALDLLLSLADRCQHGVSYEQNKQLSASDNWLCSVDLHSLLNNNNNNNNICNRSETFQVQY